MNVKEKKEEFDVAKVIRGYQTMKGLSIEALVEYTGLSPEQLIQIENGEVYNGPLKLLRFWTNILLFEIQVPP